MAKYKDIYEMFGCRNRYELYEKGKKEPQLMESILNAFYYKKARERASAAIENPRGLCNYALALKAPQGAEVWVIFTDIKNYPVYTVKADLAHLEKLPEQMVNGIRAGGSQSFLYYAKDADQGEVFRYFQEQFSLLDIEVIDRIWWENGKENSPENPQKQFYSVKSQQSFLYQADKKKTTAREARKESISFLSGEKEFLAYYGEREVEGLHIAKDSETIKSLLKIAYQREGQEVFGYLAYDESGTIYKAEPIFRGGRDRSSVDMKNIMEKIYQDDRMRGIAIYHNHPSGIAVPSPEDDFITKKILAVAAHMGFELADHFVIGSRVYSYAQENPEIGADIIHFAQKERGKISELAAEYDEKTALLKELKAEIIHFCNREYGNHYQAEEFKELYPDEKNVCIAYTEIGDYEMEYTLNLKEYTWMQLVNEKAAALGTFPGKSAEDKLRSMIAHVKDFSFEEAVLIQEEETEILTEETTSRGWEMEL